MMGVVDVTSSTAPEPAPHQWQREQAKAAKWAEDLQLTWAKETQLIPLNRIIEGITEYNIAANRLFEIAPAKNRDNISGFLKVIRENMSYEYKMVWRQLQDYLYLVFDFESPAELKSKLEPLSKEKVHDIRTVMCMVDNCLAMQRSANIVMDQALQVAKYNSVNWVALTEWIEDRLYLDYKTASRQDYEYIPDVSRAVTNAIVYGQYWDKGESPFDDTLTPPHPNWEEGHPTISRIVNELGSEDGIRLGQVAHHPRTICTHNPATEIAVYEARAAWLPEAAHYRYMEPDAAQMPEEIRIQNQWFADLELQVPELNIGVASIRYYMGSEAPFDPQAVPVRPIYPAHVGDADRTPRQLRREFVHQVRYDAVMRGYVNLLNSTNPDHWNNPDYSPEYKWKASVKPGFMAVAWSLKWWSAANKSDDSFESIASRIDALNDRRETRHVFNGGATTAKDYFKDFMEQEIAIDGTTIQSVATDFICLKVMFRRLHAKMVADEELGARQARLGRSRRARPRARRPNTLTQFPAA